MCVGQVNPEVTAGKVWTRPDPKQHLTREVVLNWQMWIATVIRLSYPDFFTQKRPKAPRKATVDVSLWFELVEIEAFLLLKLSSLEDFRFVGSRKFMKGERNLAEPLTPASSHRQNRIAKS